MKKSFFILFLSLPFVSYCQIIATFAGNSIAGYSGNGGVATSAKLNGLTDMAADRYGNIYIADAGNNVIRKVNSSGIISTVVGTDTAGFSGDNGPATAAKLNSPDHIAFDELGNLYIADNNNDVVRKVDTSGIISTFAGIGYPSCCGDGGPAIAAGLNGIWGLATDHLGNVYIVDGSNFVIRKVDTSGIISTYAGNGFMGYSGDGGPAVLATLYPTGVGTDSSGNLYIADAGNNVVRKVNTAGIISTIAGNGSYSYSGDGGPAVSAGLHSPYDVATDNAGNIYIADYNNNVIREVNEYGIITTIAGDDTSGYSGDGGAATNAKISFPKGIAIQNNGDVYIADFGNNVVRYFNNSTTLGQSLICNKQVISLYPNPAVKKFIVASSEKITSLSITNLIGQTLYCHEYNSPQVQVDVADLPLGMYLVRINGTEVRKFVKQ